MRFPRVRLTVRRLMAAVALVAAALGLWRYGVALSRDPGPLVQAGMTPQWDRYGRHPVGRPILFAIAPGFRFRDDPATRRQIVFGKVCEFRTQVWIEDTATRPPPAVLDRYSSDRRIRAGIAGGWVTHLYSSDERLIAGFREQAGGRITWPVIPDRPGRYAVCYAVSYRGFWGRWKEMFGGESFGFQSDPTRDGEARGTPRSARGLP